MAIRFTEDFYNENKELISELVKKLDKPVLVGDVERTILSTLF